MNSTLLLEELGLGGNLLGNQGISVILRAASCPLGITEKSILGLNNNKNTKNLHNIININNMKNKNENGDINYFGENVFHRKGTNSTEGEISDCISNIVFGSEHNPFEGVLLRKLNLGNSELNLESLKNLNDFLSTFKIRKKMSRNDDVINHEFGSDSVEIEFCFTENSANDLVDEVAKLNNIHSKNTENELNKNGFVLLSNVDVQFLSCRFV